MRQVVLDTETTGIGPEQGHRVIEIGCVEMIDRKVTGQHYHVYINPLRPVDPGAFKVHGISDDFLKDKPLFSDVIDDFIQFINGAELIIHNAPFDVGFLNSEFKHVKHARIIEDYCDIFDSLVYAREKHPGQRNSLDALCKRYETDNSQRDLHGALLDAEILAYVYLTMTGGQASLMLDDESHAMKQKQSEVASQFSEIIDLPVLSATSDEISAHNKLIDMIKAKSGIDLWSN